MKFFKMGKNHENEDFLWQLEDVYVGEIVKNGVAHCFIIHVIIPAHDTIW